MLIQWCSHRVIGTTIVASTAALPNLVSFSQRHKGPDQKALKRIELGLLPKQTKTSTRTAHRSRVLSGWNARRAELKSRYFDSYSSFKVAPESYRNGDLSDDFPQGTYRPYVGPIPSALSPVEALVTTTALAKRLRVALVDYVSRAVSDQKTEGTTPSGCVSRGGPSTSLR